AVLRRLQSLGPCPEENQRAGRHFTDPKLCSLQVTSVSVGDDAFSYVREYPAVIATAGHDPRPDAGEDAQQSCRRSPVNGVQCSRNKSQGAVSADSIEQRCFEF